MSSNFKDILIKFFTKNIIWKLFSVFIAAALWFLVMNINNPTEVRTFSTKLNILNEEHLQENNLKIINFEDLENTEVKVKVKGTRQGLTELNKKSNRERIKAFLNLSQFKSVNILEVDEFISNIEINLPNLSYTYEVLSIDPVTSIIKIDKVSTIKKTVVVKEKGHIRDGFAISEVKLSENEVEVTGAKSQLNKIESVFLEINLEDVTSNTKKSIKPVAYDISGNKIEDIEFNPEKITATIPVYALKTITISEPVLMGSLKEGFTISSITFNPKQFNVFIKEENLEQFNKEITPTINVEGLDKTTEFTFYTTDFLKEENIIYENPIEIKITVNIKETSEINNEKTGNTSNINNTENIDSIEKEIIIPFSKIEFINKNDNFEIEPKDLRDLKVNLIGKKDDLEKITEENIKALVDLKDIKEGTHNLEVKVEVPREVYVKESAKVEILISTKEDSLE